MLPAKRRAVQTAVDDKAAARTGMPWRLQARPCHAAPGTSTAAPVQEPLPHLPVKRQAHDNAVRTRGAHHNNCNVGDYRQQSYGVAARTAAILARMTDGPLDGGTGGVNGYTDDARVTPTTRTRGAFGDGLPLADDRVASGQHGRSATGHGRRLHALEEPRLRR